MAENEDVEVIVVTPEEREMLGLPPEGEAAPPVKVEIEGETPAVEAKKPEAKAPPVKEAAKPDESDEAFAELRRQRDEADRARQEAEARAAGAETQVSAAMQQKIQADHQTVMAAIDKVKADAEKAENAYASALENGDFKEAARQQRVMAQAETRLDKLDDLRGTIERAKSAPPRQQPAEGRVQPQLPADPVERQLATGGYSPASASWLRAHPECLTDQGTHNKLLAAHYDAVASGIKPDTADYFAALEAKVYGASASGRIADAEPEARTAPRKTIAAPPSRSAPSSNTTVRNGQTVVKLTKAEADYCRETGEDINEYAANKLALMREGKLPAN